MATGGSTGKGDEELESELEVDALGLLRELAELELSISTSCPSELSCPALGTISLSADPTCTSTFTSSVPLEMLFPDDLVVRTLWLISLSVPPASSSGVSLCGFKDVAGGFGAFLFLMPPLEEARDVEEPLYTDVRFVVDPDCFGRLVITGADVCLFNLDGSCCSDKMDDS
jgi:hypothetical protein